MYIYIDDKNFWLDSGCFPEKITRLKQINPVKFKINLYIDPINVDRLRNTDLEISNQLDFLKSLKKIPETIYVSKSDYYWWCFDGCQLIDKKIYQDKNYYDYSGRDIKKWNIELTISYKDVWGSNKKAVLDRDLKLNKLFNE
jgi:hypothetical protein